MRLILSAILMVLASTTAQATCSCRCVDGQMQPICSNSMEIPPLCPPTICPLTAPSIAPLQPPMLPPLGTSSCRQARVCNAFGSCSWQTVCR